MQVAQVCAASACAGTHDGERVVGNAGMGAVLAQQLSDEGTSRWQVPRRWRRLRRHRSRLCGVRANRVVLDRPSSVAVQGPPAYPVSVVALPVFQLT